ncbi:MAG: hypothetical protein SGCHY_001624 [Lobulomycetales sp.]
MADRVSAPVSASGEAGNDDEEVLIEDLQQVNVGLPVAEWIKTRLIQSARSAVKEVLSREEEVLDKMYSSTAIPVFASLLEVRDGFEKQASRLISNEKADLSVADDMMDKIDAINDVLKLTNLNAIAHYDVEELASVIEKAQDLLRTMI